MTTYSISQLREMANKLQQSKGTVIRTTGKGRTKPVIYNELKHAGAFDNVKESTKTSNTKKNSDSKKSNTDDVDNVTDKAVVLFYGHGLDNPYGKLSNWSRSPFIEDGNHFVSSEQYIMWRKAKLFRDRDTAQEIMNTATEEDLLVTEKKWSLKMNNIKKLGRKVSPFDEEVWVKNREEILMDALKLKFRQNKDAAKVLLDTGTALIAEAALRDKIYGIGMGQSNVNAQNPKNWKGLNLLGTSLVKIREELKNK